MLFFLGMVDDPKQGGEELLHTTPKPKGPLAAREEEILAFWNKEKIFEKSVAKDAPKGEYIFYDGPPGIFCRVPSKTPSRATAQWRATACRGCGGGTATACR